jgi:LmbE family N-acetylglucosaminyl deacetylase
MTWIYLAPHFDDIALSCGGLLWEQARSGVQPEVWTLCGGFPPAGALSPLAENLHARWQTGPAVVATRRAEDRLSCQVMQAIPVHFSTPDCIYRLHPQNHTYLYPTNAAIFGPIHPVEAGLADSTCQQLAGLLPPLVDLVCPLTLGGHVDHRVARQAAERLADWHSAGDGLAREFRLWYYADYPYVLTDDGSERDVYRGLEAVVFPVSPAGLAAWEAAVGAHVSQVSSFWPDQAARQVALRAYRDENGGVRLWRRMGSR